MFSRISDRRTGWWMMALVACAALYGCDTATTDLLQPTELEGWKVKPKDASVAVPVDAMTTAIQDEYRAQVTYAKVLVDFGVVKPFSNIVSAEGKHVEAISRLFVVNGLEVPASEWNEGNVPTFALLADACAASVTTETATAAMYDGFLLLELPSNVRKVFERLRDASALRHVRAFERCM
jgi:hypothetical protein